MAVDKTTNKLLAVGEEAQRMLGRAVSLNSSPKTIANQQTSVLHKLGLANRSEFIRVFSAYFPPSSPKFP